MPAVLSREVTLLRCVDGRVPEVGCIECGAAMLDTGIGPAPDDLHDCGETQVRAATAAASESWLLLSLDVAVAWRACQPNSEDSRVHWLGDEHEGWELLPQVARPFFCGLGRLFIENTLLEELARALLAKKVVISGEERDERTERVFSACLEVVGPEAVLPEKCCSAVICVGGPNDPAASRPSEIS